MPRDVNGNYSLPAGNPVVTNTLISSVWANTTLGDVATALSNSLDRTGASAGMTGQLKAADGAVGAPGYTFGSEPASGLYRAGAADFRFSVAATDRLLISANGIGTTLVRAGDGAVGGPSFSWTSESSSGWYKGGANDFRFAIGGADVVKFLAASVTVPTLIVTGSTIPANGIYLSAANTLALSSNGVARISVNATGNWGFAAASSGTSVTATSPSGGVGLQVLATGSTDILLAVSGSAAGQQGAIRFDSNAAVAAFMGAVGTTNQLVTGSAVGDLVIRTQNGGFRISNNSGGGTQFLILGNTNTSAIQCVDDGGTLQVVGFRGTPLNTQNSNYTFILADRGKAVNFNGAGSVSYTVNTGVFSAGDVVTIRNTTGGGGTITITQGAGFSLFWAGAGLTTGSRTLSAMGVATIVFDSGSQGMISGVGLT